MKKMYQKPITNQRGAVSLFIVIFTALLLTTVTISFMQIMMRDQQQSSYSDLSESAYDSALAGVEDAKRALLKQQDCIGDSSIACSDVRAAIDAGSCTTLADIFGGGAGGEVRIMQNVGDSKLEQAYTCVKIQEDTDDYLGTLEQNASSMTLIPLRGSAAFDRVILSWSQSKNGGPVDLPPSGNIDLPEANDVRWPVNRPALMRAQLINGGANANFRLSDFNGSGFSNTLFLHPSSTGATSLSFNIDGRRGAFEGEPQRARCLSSVASGEYACQVELSTSALIPANNQTVYLGLAALYRATDFRVELRDSSNADTSARVSFDGVQPEVDSTGRANDLFRRVVSRVELNNTFNYPLAALETRYSICKNFSVTTDTADYQPLVNCNPTGTD